MVIDRRVPCSIPLYFSTYTITIIHSCFFLVWYIDQNLLFITNSPATVALFIVIVILKDFYAIMYHSAEAQLSFLRHSETVIDYFCIVAPACGAMDGFNAYIRITVHLKRRLCFSEHMSFVHAYDYNGVRLCVLVTFLIVTFTRVQAALIFGFIV